MRRARILVAEHEDATATELARLLELLGHHVVAVVSTGEQAMRAAREAQVDLAIVDIELGGSLTGTETALRLRRELSVAVVFATTHADEATLDRVEVAEPFGYLVKPIDQRALLVTLETAFNAQEMCARRLSVERAQRRSDAMHAAILAQCHDAIICIDTQQAITTFNAGAEHLFGYNEHDVRGKPIEMLLPEQAVDRHRLLVAEYARGSTAARPMGAKLELQARHKSGDLIPVEISISRLQIEGEVVMTAFVRDISQRKLLLETLDRSRRLESIGRLAGGVAHDFNNLLTGIFVYANSLRSSFDPSDRRNLEVNRIVEAADRAAALVRQLLVVAQHEHTFPQPTDLNALLLRLQVLVEPLLGEQRRLELKLQPGLPPVVVDPTKIERVAMNLVLNARDAMPTGGTITLETKACDGELPAQPGKSDAPGVQFSVVDTGIGMDAKTQSRIFEPFFTTKQTRGGVGLGLATTHSIVTQSGGEIRLTSRLGAGTRFDVLLPALAVAVQGAEQTPERTSASEVSAPKSAKILIVDDDALVRDAIHRMLSRHGDAVTVVDSGAAALRVILEQSASFDLVITDVSMPNMNGHELVQHLRSARPDLKLALMSGYTDDDIRRSYSMKDAPPLLAKPFDRNTLLHWVSELLSQQSPGEASTIDAA
jgi:PAS domain S-box-containing protein